jgi:hypothetical protein
MDKCYICLDNTSIYYKYNNCNCIIYCHEECFDKIKNNNKCIICRNNIFINKENFIYSIFEKTLLYKITMLLINNSIFDYLLEMNTYLHFIFFILYSLFNVLIIIILAIITIISYYSIYLYNYKYINSNKYNKFFIKN